MHASVLAASIVLTMMMPPGAVFAGGAAVSATTAPAIKCPEKTALEALQVRVANGEADARYEYSQLICARCVTPQGSGEMRLLDSSSTAKMKSMLKDSKDLKHLMPFYFGDMFNPKLADWVVYVEKSGDVHQILLDKDGACQKDTASFGGNNTIYAMVFSDLQAKATVRLTPLGRYQGPSERVFDALARSYSAIFDKDKVVEVTKKSALDSDSKNLKSEINLVNISTKSGEPLFYGYAELPMQTDTWNRLTLTPTDGVFPGTELRSVSKSFINGEPGHLGFSLFFGGTINAPGKAEGKRSDVRPRLFLAADWTPGVKSTFTPPWTNPLSNLSFFAGTNVTGDLLDEFAFGVYVRRLAEWTGPLGVGAGVSLSQVEALSGNTRMEPRCVAGFSYPL